MANKMTLDFKGFEDLLSEYEGMGGDVKRAVTGALIQSKQLVTKQAEEAIGKHRRTGQTAASIDRGHTVTWNGNYGSIDVGFHISEGGLPSIFLMYGTPRHTPVNQYGKPKRSDAGLHPGMDADRKLYNAIYGSGTKKKIRKLQEEAVRKVIRRTVGGG